jgi:hypothetical protein
MAVQSNSSGDFSSLLAAMGQLRERSGARVRTIDSHQLTKNPFFFFSSQHHTTTALMRCVSEQRNVAN